MSPAAEAIDRSALELPEAERLELAEELVDASTGEPPCPEPRGGAYLREIQRRSVESNPKTWLTIVDLRRRLPRYSR